MEWKEVVMSKSNPLEKVIEGKVADHAKGLGMLVYKFTSPSRRSVPDRLFVMPGGKGCFFVEFKRRGEKPTKAQAVEIAKIRGQGARVFIIDDTTAGRCCVTDMLHGVVTGEHVFGYAPHASVTMEDPFFN